MTPAHAAGYDGTLLPLFPAAATTVTPFAIAAAAAAHMVDPGPPRLRLMTFAPFETAHAIPLAIDAIGHPSPTTVPKQTLIGMTGDETATPATPVPLSVTAPAIPAT